MMKRFAAIAAMSLVAFQAVSGVAMGASVHLGSGTTPIATGASNQCPDAPVLGVLNVSVTNDVTFSADSDADELSCDSKHYAFDDVDRVVFYGKTNNAVDVTFDLEDKGDGGKIADFQGLGFTVRTTGDINIDGSGVTDDRDDFDVTLEDDAFSVDEADLEVTITYAKNYYVELGAGDDTVDGKKVTEVGFEADAGVGNDVIYGGAGDDTLNCDKDGSDYVNDGADQCWGGDGDDEINADFDVVAPGAGDDDISGTVLLATYGDSKSGVVIDAGSGEVESDAGDDDFDGDVYAWAGSSKADKFYGETDPLYAFDDVFSGGAGDDTAFGGAGNDTLRGGAGDDVLKGGRGSDKLRGDAGSDEAWGGRGKDACGAEVTDNCEFFRN